MPLIIREACSQDLPAIQRIYNAESLHGFATWNEQAYSLEELEQKLLDFQTQGYPFFVIADTDGAQIAGYADYAAFRNFSGYRHTVEHSVYIDPAYARQGLGQRLMQHLIEYAQAHQVHVMVAGIDHGNSASIALHQKLGFVQTGYLPQVGKKFGQWRDLVLMQLTFDQPHSC